MLAIILKCLCLRSFTSVFMYRNPCLSGVRVVFRACGILRDKSIALQLMNEAAPECCETLVSRFSDDIFKQSTQRDTGLALYLYGMFKQTIQRDIGLALQPLARRWSRASITVASHFAPCSVTWASATCSATSASRRRRPHTPRSGAQNKREPKP